MTTLWIFTSPDQFCVNTITVVEPHADSFVH
jgi:hypothetical protein